MSVDLAAEWPPVKPWEQRAKSLTGLAGGAGSYLDTLRWLIEQCRDGLDKAELAERYQLHFNLSDSTADVTISDLQTAGLLVRKEGLCLPTDSARLWLESQHNETVIGTLHASVRFVGELLHEIRAPRTRKSLLETANGSYGFTWHRPTQIGCRLNWLLSAGLVRKPRSSEYQATDVGVAFLERIDLHPATTDSSADEPRQPVSDNTQRPPADGPPKPAKIDTNLPTTSVSPPATADEIAQRLANLSCDGAKHKGFEVAVRDAFSFLGLEAKQLSGAGQTDVLVSGVRNVGASGHADSASRSFVAVVEVKAVGNGRLTSNQVDLMTIKKHRSQHGADYALIVGPGPAGQLLDYARDEGIGVLDSARFAEIVRAQDEMPLAAREFQRLFADAAGGPAGGEVDLRPLEETRKQHRRLRDLLEPLSVIFGRARGIAEFQLGDGRDANEPALDPRQPFIRVVCFFDPNQC